MDFFYFSVGMALTHLYISFFSTNNAICDSLFPCSTQSFQFSIYRSQSPAQAALFVFIGGTRLSLQEFLVNLSFSIFSESLPMPFLHKTVIYDQLA